MLATMEANETFYMFLEGMKLAKEVIERMKLDGISKEVVQNMSDKELKEYVTSYGARIMIFGYCKKSNPDQKRKQNILKKIRNKLQKRDSNLEIEKDNTFGEVSQGRPIASTRKIELGWLCDDKNQIKQVRLKSGGGTRHLDVLKSTSAADILEMAISLFFPNGMSAKGPKDGFYMELVDFKQSKLDYTKTVQQFYEESKLSSFRFYLLTKAKVVENKAVEDIAETDKAVKDIAETDKAVKDIAETDKAVVDIAETDKAVEDIAETDNAVEDIMGDDNVSKTFQQTFSVDEEIIFNLQFHPHSDQGENVLNSQEIVIKVRLATVFLDILHAFMDRTLLFQNISFVRVLPNGDIENGAGSGVVRDTYTAFWNAFYEQYTVGDMAKVPFIRHDFDGNKWQSIARVLVKGYKDVGYWPTKLAKPFLEEALFGCVVSNLIEVFFQHLNLAEREILKKSLEDFENVDKDDLIDVLGSIDCKKIVNAQNVKEVIEELSHKELIQKPMFIIDNMKIVFSNEAFGFIDFDTFNSLYTFLIPTYKRVLEMLQFPLNMNDYQNQIAHFLKKYIRGLNSKSLELFLRFCTGLDQISLGDIQVEFREMSENTKRPIAHTCGRLLELPLNFDNFAEFQSMFENVFKSDVWVMDIV